MKQKDPGDQINEQTLQQLILRKKLLNRQVQKIKQMTYHQALNKKRKQDVQAPSPTVNYLKMMQIQKLKQSGFQENLEQIVNKRFQMIDQIQKKNIIKRKQMRQSPIFSQIKRGKLGMDGFFILFAIFGSIMLPAFFYSKFKSSKEQIIKNRILTPQQIEKLDEDSPINIDEVSDQTIHYDNPERRKKFQQFMQRSKKISALKQQLDL